MTKEDRKEQSIDDLFGDAEIISSYSERDAVEDGVFFDVQELAKLSPSIKWNEGPFQYVTSNLCYSKGYAKAGENVQVAQVANFIDLFRNMGEHMKRTGPDNFYNATIEFPDGSKGEVYAVLNSSRRYTLMLPADY